MLLFISKTVIAALLISFSSWLSEKQPNLAGFIVALPMATIIVLVFAHTEHQNPATSIAFAKSIFVGVPISLLFFVPFLLAEKLNISFWSCYLGGIALLVIGFFLHKAILTFL
ncbi:MAG: hypothetical protein ACE5E9_08880 [Nitrospinaceae bacterium]